MSDLEQMNVDGTLELAKLAAEINAEHRACDAALRSGLAHALKAGELLVEAKTHTRHGGWGRWLAENFEGSPRMATNYMLIFRRREELANRKRASDLDDLSIRGALRELATPKAPTLAEMADEVDKLLRQVDALPLSQAELSLRITEGLAEATRGILKLERLELDKATTPQECKALSDVSLHLQNAWAESHINSQREMGSLLAEMEA